MFNGNAAARTALSKMGEAGPGYQPLRRSDVPKPDHLGDFTRMPWTNDCPNNDNNTSEPARDVDHLDYRFEARCNVRIRLGWET